MGTFGNAPIVKDFRARRPLYYSDWRITASSEVSKIASASLFSYIAGIFPALIFGELLYNKTEGLIGVPEVLLSTGGMGILWSFFAGQPLVIVGVTGPVMMFVSVVFQLSTSIKAPFVPWLGWVGVWSGLMHLLLAISGAAAAVRHVTAFSGEVFGFFISVSYIYDALDALLGPLFKGYEAQNVGVNASSLSRESMADIEYGTAFASLLLSLFTCTFALLLHHAEAWRQFGSKTRTLCAAYATAIAVIVLTAVSYIPSFDETAGLNRLNLPTGGIDLSPSTGRSWANDLGVGATGGPFENLTETIGNTTTSRSQPNSLQGWQIGAALLPAFLLTALFFFDHNVSSLLSQQPRFHLVKPSAYNLDFGVLGVLVILTGVFGVPPGNGLIPQAPLHVRALATIELVKDPQSGEVREEYRKVLETRWSNLIQSTAILLTFVIYVVLGTIPQGVLYGIFLFMGITGFSGNDLYTRLWLLITQADLRPRTAYITDMKFSAVRMYTLIQLSCVVVVFIVAKLPAWTSATVAPYIAVTFPLFIAAFVPLRSHLLPRYFGPGELDLLDPPAPDAVADDPRDDKGGTQAAALPSSALTELAQVTVTTTPPTTAVTADPTVTNAEGNLEEDLGLDDLLLPSSISAGDTTDGSEQPPSSLARQASATSTSSRTGIASYSGLSPHNSPKLVATAPSPKLAPVPPHQATRNT